MDNPRVMLETAINCGLIVNELVTNTLKYAFPEGKMGEIRIRLNRDEESRIHLIVSDNGIGAAPGFDLKRDGRLGLRLIDSLAHGRLQAQIEFNTDRGFLCALIFADEEKPGAG
jgi:two-component sensor histidine kinase